MVANRAKHHILSVIGLLSKDWHEGFIFTVLWVSQNILWGHLQPSYTLTQILRGALINENLGHSTLIYLVLITAACKFSQC